MYRRNAWEKYREEDLRKVMDFNEGYKRFLSSAKTERECVKEAVRLAEEKGFVNLQDVFKSGRPLKAGDKLYGINRHKNVVLFVLGEKPLEEGMRILGAHIDSPRLDLKPNPLYEEGGLVLADTHYYGGIKKYQWTALPLAIHGVVVRRDGSKAEIRIGEEDGEPVVGISDLLYHFSEEQLKKSGETVVEGENLDVTFGHMPLKDTEKEAVKSNILKLLKETYDIEEEDFFSAELEIVPAGAAKDYGLDRSMVMAYGQDDRVGAYTSLAAVLDLEHSRHTACCVLFDKEEIGDVGATGAHSLYLENLVAELIWYMGNTSPLAARQAMARSKMFSCDVSAAFDPLYPEVYEKKNTAILGHGMVLSKYTGSGGKIYSNDANPEYIASLRGIFESAGVNYQTAEQGKVDTGMFQTIAYIMSSYNLDVIDAGVAVMNMHAPWEVVSKADVYETYFGCKTFLEKM